MAEDRLVEAYSAKDAMEAHFLRLVLEEHDIPVRVINDGLGFALGDLPLGWLTSPKLWVREEDLAMTRALITEWQKTRRANAAAEEPTS